VFTEEDEWCVGPAEGRLAGRSAASEDWSMEMGETVLWWRNSAAVMGFSRCGWRLLGGAADVKGRRRTPAAVWIGGGWR